MAESPATLPTLVGMVHLLPLPGAPRFDGSMQAAIEDGIERATTLVDAGFGALMVENFGDDPFYANRVPPVTVAALTACVLAIRSKVDVPVGVNVLRNDAFSAVGVAAASRAEVIRVNVLSGTMYTDQGPIVGEAADVVRERGRVAPATEIWADVFVKHASPPPGSTLEQAAADLWHRGGADALIVSGTGTGLAPELGTFDRLRSVVPDAPLVVGSGATPANLPRLAEVADHVIVGTSLELGGVPGAGLDPPRIAAFLEAAHEAGLS